MVQPSTSIVLTIQQINFNFHYFIGLVSIISTFSLDHGKKKLKTNLQKIFLGLSGDQVFVFLIGFSVITGLFLDYELFDCDFLSS